MAGEPESLKYRETQHARGFKTDPYDPLEMPVHGKHNPVTKRQEVDAYVAGGSVSIAATTNLKDVNPDDAAELAKFGKRNPTTKREEVDAYDDYNSLEAQHATLVASTDTTFTFSQAVRLVRVTNWDIAARVLVKNGAIATNVDATASRVGKAAAADLPNSEVYPLKTSSIHLRSTAAVEVTVEGFA